MQIGEESSHEKQKKALRFWDRENVMTENYEGRTREMKRIL